MPGDNRVNSKAAINHLRGGEQKQSYLLPEIAEIFECKLSTVQTWCRTGKLASVKTHVGGSRQLQYVVSRSSLARFANDVFLKKGSKGR